MRAPSSTLLLAFVPLSCGRLGFDPDGSRDSGAIDPDSPGDMRDSPGDVRDSYRDAVLADGPIGYWRLGDSPGGVARDEVGANDGIYDGQCMYSQPGALTSDSDTAVRFAPSADRCEITFGTRFDFAGRVPFSIEAWIAPTEDRPYGHVFSRQSRTTAPSMPVDGYALLESPGGVYAERAVSGANVQTSRLLLTTDVFMHVVVTYDSTEICIYVDSMLRSCALDSRPGNAVNAPAMIGCAVSNSNCFEGVVDEVALYDRALSAFAVEQHFAAR